MNLNSNNKDILHDELKILLAQYDDEDGDYCIWIDTQGDVHITEIPDGELDRDSWFNMLPRFKVRMETTEKGKGWVGNKAVTDETYIEKLLEDLLETWRNGDVVVTHLI